jgi:hypothetical protein
VEVTKLSLLLKVLDEEDVETIQTLLTFSDERALPDLDKNIKCGNSIVSDDIELDDMLYDLFKPFNWASEFSEIMDGGGFDAVIGNPPYVRQESLGNIKPYLTTHYQVYQGTADLYVYFIEQSHRLLRPRGLFGIIVSNKWMRAKYGMALRHFFSERTTLLEIIDFGELPVFQNASTFPAIVLTENIPTNEQGFLYAPIKKLDFTSLDEEVEEVGLRLDSRSICGDNWSLANIASVTIMEKMNRVSTPLEKYVEGKIYYGIKSGLNEAFVIDVATKEKLIAEDPRSIDVIKPFLMGRDLKRYHPPENKRYLIFIRRGTNIEG